MHRKRFNLSCAGQPVQYLPTTDAYLPTAIAVFGSIDWPEAGTGQGLLLSRSFRRHGSHDVVVLLAEPVIRVYSVSYGPNAPGNSFPAVPSCQVGSVELQDESGGHSSNPHWTGEHENTPKTQLRGPLFRWH